MTETNFVGLVKPTYNNALTMEHTNRSIPHNDLITWSLDHLVTSKPLRGFTMAEILLSLTIIGVVAAITLPSLMANINERTWNTQRKALYARMSQAIAMMPQLNGYGEYEGTNTDGSVSVTKDTAAEAFLTEGLSKVLKINNICDSEHLADCGVPTSYTNMAESVSTWPTTLSEFNKLFTRAAIIHETESKSVIYANPQLDVDTKAAAFETQSGESVTLFYNPRCWTRSQGVQNYVAGSTDYDYAQPLMCANFIYDLNGNKGPNTFRKDIGFVTVMYSDEPVVVAPVMDSVHTDAAVTFDEAKLGCVGYNADSRLPNIDELSAIFYNRYFIGNLIINNDQWSSTVETPGAEGLVWVQGYATGHRVTFEKTITRMYTCVKR